MNFRQFVIENLKHMEIAKTVGRAMNKPAMSAQAVGGAVGSNPISILIPCHRVVGKDGNLTGYGGTLDNKIKLLKLEEIDMTHLYRPKNNETLRYVIV